MVTPYAGVWIEMAKATHTAVHLLVTPYAGVWIEIVWLFFVATVSESLPTRECGLK